MASRAGKEEGGGCHLYMLGCIYLDCRTLDHERTYY